MKGKMLIGGRSVDTRDHFYIDNPYTGERVGQAPNITDKQLEQVLQGAYNCKFNLTGDDRADILNLIADRIRDHKQELAEIITAELGICIKQSQYELERSDHVFRAAANVARAIDQEDHTSKYRGAEDKAELSVISEPLRLIVGITPFNHPLNQVAHKIAPAIAARTPIILKPSEKTPLTALRLGELIKDIVPPYTVNIITRSPPQSLVDALVTDERVDAVFYTGNPSIGQYISKKISSSPYFTKNVVLELGGSAPLIILNDADLDLAAKTALGAFDNSGQRCTAVRRIIVENSVAEPFIEKFLEKTKDRKYGNPLDPAMDMGTVVNEEAAMRIEERVHEAIRYGAALLHGEKRKGALFPPTVLDFVVPTMKLVQEETFGPVAPIMRAANMEDAISLARQSKYGLAGAVITQDQQKAEYVAKKLNLGQFSWNGPPGYRTEQTPFGGRGQSGNFKKEGVIDAAQEMRWTRTFYRHS